MPFHNGLSFQGFLIAAKLLAAVGWLTTFLLATAFVLTELEIFFVVGYWWFISLMLTSVSSLLIALGLKIYDRYSHRQSD